MNPSVLGFSHGMWEIFLGNSASILSFPFCKWSHFWGWWSFTWPIAIRCPRKPQNWNIFFRFVSRRIFPGNAFEPASSASNAEKSQISNNKMDALSKIKGERWNPLEQSRDKGCDTKGRQYCTHANKVINYRADNQRLISFKSLSSSPSSFIVNNDARITDPSFHVVCLSTPDVPNEQQVSPDSTSPSSQTQLLPGPEHHDDLSIDSYRGYPSPTNYRSSSPDAYRDRSPIAGGPDTTDNISNQRDEIEEEDSHEQIAAEVRTDRTILEICCLRLLFNHFGSVAGCSWFTKRANHRTQEKKKKSAFL